MNLKKPIDVLVAESAESGEGTLKRTLSSTSLVALGIGAIIGAGLFSLTGIAAADRRRTASGADRRLLSRRPGGSRPHRPLDRRPQSAAIPADPGGAVRPLFQPPDLARVAVCAGGGIPAVGPRVLRDAIKAGYRANDTAPGNNTASAARNTRPTRLMTRIFSPSGHSTTA